MLEYRVIDERNNTTITKTAKSYRYLCWMYWNVYSEQSKNSYMHYDNTTKSYVIVLH